MGGTRATHRALRAAGGAARGRDLWTHLGKPGSRALLLGGGLHQAGTALLAQPIAVAADGDDLAVVQQAIEDRGGDDGIAEHAAPFPDRAVAGDQHAAALVAA